MYTLHLFSFFKDKQITKKKLLQREFWANPSEKKYLMHIVKCPITKTSQDVHDFNKPLIRLFLYEYENILTCIHWELQYIA